MTSSWAMKFSFPLADVCLLRSPTVGKLTSGKAPVNMEALRRIRAQVEVPLVIHGGTGFPSECAADVIKLGVAKFNFGTVLKQAYLAAVREELAPVPRADDPPTFFSERAGRRI